MKEEKSNNLVVKQDDILAIAKNSVEDKLLGAQKMAEFFNRDPQKNLIAVVQSRKYIPVSHLEMLMDQCFFGQWSTKNISTTIVANEVLVTLEVEAIHPTTGYVVTRTGAGTSMIEMEHGAQITDINAKKKNALVKNFPSAKSMAFKNAVKSFGAMFGRDLLRKDKHTGEFKPLIKESAERAKEKAEQRRAELEQKKAS